MALQINNLTGEIDVSASTPGKYIITRTVTNSNSSLSSSATDIVTINPADNAAFSYSGSPFDIADASNPTPTVTGLSGGTFNSIDHFEFNGTDDFIDFPVQADFPDAYIMPQDPRTLSVWINPSDVNSGYKKPLISNRLWKNLYYQGYSLTMRSGGVLQFTFFLNKSNVDKYWQVRTTETLSANTWYNIVLTDNGDLSSTTTSATDILNNYTIYINNVPATLANHSYGLPSGFIGSATNWYGARLNIGAAEGHTSSGNTSYFPGLMSNASIFTESLTSAKVDELYNNGIPGNLSNHSSSSNLIGWWKLGDDATYNSSTSTWSFPNAANPGTGGGTSTSLPSTAIKTIDLNSTTGLISLSNSNVGNYGIVYNTTGATGSICPATDTQSVQLVNTNFNYPSNLCNASGSPNVTPTNFIQQTGGQFTISPTSGLTINATSGVLSPANSTPGIYAIKYKIGNNETVKNVTSGAVLAPLQTTNTSVLSFNGTSSYIASSYSGNVTALSLWFKPNSTITTSTSPQYIINFGGAWNGVGLGAFTSALTNELIIVTDASVAGRSAYTSSSSISADWHHLLINWSGSVYEIWLDGTNVQNAATGTPTLINASSIEIGRRSASPNYYFNGEIDEVAIWDTQLTSCDVAGIYQASSNGITADLSTVYPSNLKYYNRMGD